MMAMVMPMSGTFLSGENMIMNGVSSPGKKKGPKSMFGQQHVSTRESAPQYGFGSATRNDVAKVFLTSEHEKTNFGHVSPGPVYEVTSSLGKQGSSTRLSSPNWGFGTSERFRGRLKKRAQTVHGERPSEAIKTPGIKEAPPPAFKYSEIPGPGTYRCPSSFGFQAVSTKTSANDIRFGSSTRGKSEKIFLSHEHSKVNYGTCSPGPLQYNQKSSVGMQVSSKKETLPSWNFPHEKRFKYDYVNRAKQVPGAGQYNQINACGAQTVSTKKTLPSFGFGSATRDGRDKVYVSTDHEKCRHGQQSPGPASIKVYSFMGKQVNSRKLSSSRWSFGSAKRFSGESIKSKCAPGPGAYDP